MLFLVVKIIHDTFSCCSLQSPDALSGVASTRGAFYNYLYLVQCYRQMTIKKKYRRGT